MYSDSGSVQDSLHKNLAFVRSVRRIVVFRVAVIDLQLHFFYRDNIYSLRPKISATEIFLEKVISECQRSFCRGVQYKVT
jgi:hypothetical protein